MAFTRLTASAYLQEANHAVAYVKSNLVLGSTNQPSDFIRYPALGLMRYPLSAGGQLGAAKVSVEQLKALRPQAQNATANERNLMMIEVWARNALRSKAGNCGFQAAVAFMYLKDKDVFPIDYMQLGGDADHAFVILGRDANTDLSIFADWTGGMSIVCDPWRGAAGVAGMLAVWYKTTKVDLLARLE